MAKLNLKTRVQNPFTILKIYPRGCTLVIFKTEPINLKTEIYIDDPAELKLLYAILTHRNPAETIRLVEILYEPGHVFVIHVDGKEGSDNTYEALVTYSQDKDYVHIIPHPYRCRVNWGGFSMVNATMQILKYSFGLDPSLNGTPLDFHKFVHMSSTSYPLASNTKIRQTLASFPLDANLMNIVMKPTRPHPSAWFYFVECDDWVHRVVSTTSLE